MQQLQRALTRQGVRLLLCDLNDQPMRLVHRSGFALALGAGNLQPTLADALHALQARADAKAAAP